MDPLSWREAKLLVQLLRPCNVCIFLHRKKMLTMETDLQDLPSSLLLCPSFWVYLLSVFPLVASALDKVALLPLNMNKELLY